MYCINNPGFRESYMQRIVDFVRKANLDAVMLDEVTMAGDDFCGCEHCRRKFTQETGLVLPRNNASKTFRNMDDPLWVAWLNWRRQCVGDWWVEMRKRFSETNPDVCMMIYTTHFGFNHRWAPLTLAADIIEDARACDFLGTEIMPRNVYDSWRGVYAFRKAKAALGDHFGTPIFAWLYHVDEPTFAYFGWALNHMHRQTVVTAFIEGEDMKRYFKWPYQMDMRSARSVADVAVLFSAQSRDFGKMFSQTGDAVAISQTLTDAHIQHDFILDQDLLNLRKLGRYKLVVLPSAGCLSSEQAAAIRDYVGSGGRLYASANTSMYNEFGFYQSDFQLADVFGVNCRSLSGLKPPVRFAPATAARRSTAPSWRCRPARAKAPRCAWTSSTSKARPSAPASCSTAMGKGSACTRPARSAMSTPNPSWPSAASGRSS